MKTFTKYPNAQAVAMVLGVAVFGCGRAAADFVIPDDLIVQGSACVGLDCVDGEVFGFDTIILKENNLRILFNDTSTSPGFPANKWRLIINDSASGGQNFFGVDDVTGGTQPFRIIAGAPSNSLFVASTGRVGLRTSTPALDLHIATTDTPAIRLEQTASIWPAQTWDVAGNEASFFVRDVTGGSRLPFRIRPGAPTSSIDIAASGNVGIGTGSPTSAVHVSKSGALGIKLQDISGAGSRGGFFGGGWGANGAHVDSLEPGGWVYLGTGSAGAGQVVAYTGGSERLRVDATGNVGIGTTAPTTRFHTTGGVRFAGIAGCGGGIQSDGSGNLACLVSSRQYKTITGHLSPAMALANVMALRPQVGTYIATPDQPEHWLIAEEVAAVDPALAGFKDGKPYTVKTQNVVADLVAVIQQQQRRIEVLEKALSR